MDNAIVAFEDRVVDLDALVGAGYLDEETLRGEATLNAFLGRGLTAWRAVRARLRHLLGAAATPVEREAVRRASHARADVTMHLPIAVGDYVDFYSSIEHASNVGRIFRPDGDPLLPNWRWLPIAYHGRAGTVVPSGTPMRRPAGQRSRRGTRRRRSARRRRWTSSWRSDSCSAAPALGEPVPIDRAEEHLFGWCW